MRKTLVLLVCIRMYPYVTRMLVVCIRMYPYVPYVTRMLPVCYPYVLVWCFSHDCKISKNLVLNQLNPKDPQFRIMTKTPHEYIRVTYG